MLNSRLCTKHSSITFSRTSDMVRIVGGEILQDDDPRLQQRSQGGGNVTHEGQEARQRTSTSHPQQHAPGFSLQAPAFKVIPDPDGQKLPEFEVFGVRISSTALMLVAGSGIIFGWRGLFGASLLWYLCYRSAANQPAPPQGPPPRRMNPAALQQYMMSQGGGDGSSMRQQQQQHSGQTAQQQTGGRAFTGKAYKLSSS
eukprot:jgi/Chrzof1/10097/Cz04g26280.t1